MMSEPSPGRRWRGNTCSSICQRESKMDVPDKFESGLPGSGMSAKLNFSFDHLSSLGIFGAGRRGEKEHSAIQREPLAAKGADGA